MAQPTADPHFEHWTGLDPISERYSRGFWPDEVGGNALSKHISDRYGKEAYKTKWNIGVIGFGDIGKQTIVDIETLADNNKGSDVGTFYIASSNSEAAGEKQKLDGNVISHRHGNKVQLGIDWHDLQSDKSQSTLDKIVQETDICIVTADVGKSKFERMCQEEGIDPMDKEKRREMKTRANIGWAEQIAEKFKDYKGIVLVVSNLSDDLAYVFGNHMSDPYRSIGMSYVDSARLDGLKDKIRKKIVAGVDGILGDFPELANSSAKVLNDISVYSVGTHNNPYPLIYYKGRQISELKLDDLQDVMEELRDWGFKILEYGQKTAAQTARATAETVMQMMYGLRPVPVSVLFDYKDEKDKEKQGYFTVPVMFELEEVMRGDEKRFVPRPCVIKPQMNMLLGQDGFRELLEQHAAKLRAATYKDGTPMFPVIEKYPGDDFGEVLDLGYLYVTGEEDCIVNAYRLSKPVSDGRRSTGISPFNSSSVEIEDIERIIGHEKGLTVCMSRDENDEDTFKVLESCEPTGKEYGVGCETSTAKLRENVLYVGLNEDGIGKVVCIDLNEDLEVDEVLDKVKNAHKVAPMSTFEVVDYERRPSLCVAGEDGNLYLYDAETGKLMHSAEGDSNLSFSTLKAFEKDGKTVVLGSLRHKLAAWYIGEEKTHDLPFETSSIYFDAAVEGGKIKIASVKRGQFHRNTIEVRIYESADELLSEKKPLHTGVNDPVSGLEFSKGNLVALMEGDENGIVRAYDSNVDLVSKFRLDDADLMEGYSLVEA